MPLKKLRELRAAALRAMEDLGSVIETENRGFTDEEQSKWETLEKRCADLDKQIEQAERFETMKAQRSADHGIGREPLRNPNQSEVTDEHRVLAFQAWGRAQSGRSLRPEHEEACSLVGLNPRQNELEISLLPTRALSTVRRGRDWTDLERRDLSAQLGASGAFTIPVDFIRQMEDAMLAWGGMLEACEILRTSTGGEIPWPTDNDTSNTGELIGENTDASTATADPLIGQVIFRAHIFSSKMVKTPVALLEDSAFDLAAFLSTKLGQRLGRVQNTYYTTGTGVGQPKGITVASTSGKTTAGSTAITTDEILDLIHSVDPAYRATGCSFMMHDSIVLYLRKLKDGEGRYIWQESARVGEPSSLFGYPVIINQDMASSLASTYRTMLFGQFSKYKIRQVNTIRLRRLVERYAEYDQEAFIAFMRADGNLVDAGTHPVKYMIQV